MDKTALGSFVRCIQRQRDAQEMQPWRCEVCNVAVRPHQHDPCKCHPNLKRPHGS